MSTAIGPEVLATITVTFNPDIDILRSQLQALPRGCAKIIVDNASAPELLSQIELLVGESKDTHLICSAKNVGLAAAFNLGAGFAEKLQPRPRFILLLDQDSEPQTGSIEALVGAFDDLAGAGYAVGCVGPLLQDAATGLSHGFHQCTRWRWSRVYPKAGADFPLNCANLNGSGTLTPLTLFLTLGGLEEDFFIDHVDTEWAFRVTANGYGLWGVPAAVFIHRMGAASLRFWWLRWRIWPSRTPQRHYYLMRNAVRLMRRRYVPKVWKIFACVKLFGTFMLHVCFDSRRFPQAKSMIFGLRDGLNERGENS